MPTTQPVINTVEELEREVERIDMTLTYGPVVFQAGILSVELELAAVTEVEAAVHNAATAAEALGVRDTVPENWSEPFDMEAFKAEAEANRPVRP
jgi:hypothetical protein